MIHPRLSINALCSIRWSFEQDLDLWRRIGVHHAGLLISKLEGDRKAKGQLLRGAGIRPTTIVCGGFDLSAPDSWSETRKILNGALEFAAEYGCESVYFPPGCGTGSPWDEVVAQLGKAVAPCVRYSQLCGVRLGIEPSLRVNVSFINSLRDAVDVCRQTGLAVVADFGNCWMEQDLHDVLQRASPHLCLIQITDMATQSAVKPGSCRVQIGDGDLPLQRLLHAVLDTGYRGYFDLEVLGPDVEAEGYDRAVTRGVKRASALLTRMNL